MLSITNLVCGQNLKSQVDSSIYQIENYWKMKFSQKEMVFNSPTINYYSFSQPITTICGTTNQLNAFFCAGSNSISISKDFAKLLQSKYDFRLMSFILAHEYGHAVQSQLHKTSILSIDRELQADCLAGTFLFYQQKKQNLNIVSISTIQSFFNEYTDETTGFKILTDFQAHGRADVRMKAFNKGYEIGSVNTCLNEFNVEGNILGLLEGFFDIFRK